MVTNSMNRSERDRLYAAPREEMESFVFDERVAAVFGDMITRSVPGYATIVAMTGILARRHAVDGSRIYDLGCSLGAASAVMAHSLEERECTVVAVDSAPAMLERARAELAARGLEERIELVCADIRQLEIRSAGYSELEISQKRAALEKVLVPEPVAVHRQRLVEAGFTRVDLWFQCFNFVSFVARP